MYSIFNILIGINYSCDIFTHKMESSGSCRGESAIFNRGESFDVHHLFKININGSLKESMRAIVSRSKCNKSDL